MDDHSLSGGQISGSISSPASSVATATLDPSFDVAAVSSSINRTSTRPQHHGHSDHHDNTLQPRPMSMSRSRIVSKIELSSFSCTQEERELLQLIFRSSRPNRSFDITSIATDEDSKPAAALPPQIEMQVETRSEMPDEWLDLEVYQLQPTGQDQLMDAIQPDNSMPDSEADVADRYAQLNSDRITGSQFHQYQVNRWKESFQRLVQFKRDNGHCLVPCSYSQDATLARWVKRQRHEFKRMLDGASSTMTDDRRQKLQDLGFVWDNQQLAWEERYQELVAFREEHGHCNVTNTNCGGKSHLVRWVKYQRKYGKKYFSSLSASEASASAPASATGPAVGPSSNKAALISQERIQKLNAIGFFWGIYAES